MNSIPSIFRRPAALAAALLLILPVSSRAQNRALDAAPVDLVDFSSPASIRLLLRPAPDWAAAWDPSNLWTRAILLACVPAADASDPPPALALAPLSAPYDPAAVTPSTAPAAASPAIDAVPAPAILDAAPAWRYAFDLAPVLASPAARSNLFANGAVLSSAAEGSAAVPPSTLLFRAAVPIPPSNTTAFAVGYIDTAPRFGDGTPSAVMWEQSEFYVGKVALNGSDGSECRAIVSFPEDLASIPPENIASLVATFDLEVNSTNGHERLLLFPLLPGPALERRRWEDYPGNEPPCPVHGPSWASADGPVGTAAWPATPWAVPMKTFPDGVLGDGPWLADCGVAATIVHTNQSTRLARFDLTDLWHDPVAREALAANGAIVLLDPASWAYAIASNASPRLNLYRPPDPYLRAYRPRNTNTHFSVTIAPPPAIASIRPDHAASTLTLSFENLDPARDATLAATPSLLSTNWSSVTPADLSPLVLPFPPASSPALFYRLSADP